MDEAKLEAGRTLDALIAEKVMRWKRGKLAPLYIEGENWLLPDGSEPTYCEGARGLLSVIIPNFSTDIAAAWQVVEAMKDRPGQFTNWLGFSIETYTTSSETRGYKASIGGYRATADTAPLAICLAALRVVGGVDGPTA